MAKIVKTIRRHGKTIIVLACAAVAAGLIYTDAFNLSEEKPVSDYLYNTESDGEVTKILGEATLVDSSGAETDNESSYFTGAVLNKEKSRDEALETLQVVVESSEELPEVKDKALSEIMQIASDIEKETAVEEMIKAKGFDDCVAIISGENINVIVKSPGLLTDEVARITDIVKSETGFSAENIRIVEKS